MTNASASGVLDGSNPDRPDPVATSTSTAKPAAGVAKLAKTHTARASLVPAAGSEASPERSGAPSEAAWDGPVDLWVDDVEGDWDTQLPWSVRPSDS